MLFGYDTGVINGALEFIINAIIFRGWGENPNVWRYMLGRRRATGAGVVLRHVGDAGESSWLVSKGRDADALAVLEQVRSRERAKAEMAEVHALAEEEKASQTGGGATNLGVRWIRRLIFIGVGLGVF